MSKLIDENDQLSGVFLPDITEQYVQSKFKVMIIGQETKGWNGKANIINECSNIDDYIEDSLVNKYRKYLMKKPGRIAFLQFLQKVNKLLGNDQQGSVLWGNLFAFSYAKKSPVGKPNFDFVNETSKQLLRKQIELLQPDAIIFTTGWRYDKYIKEFFPEYETENVNPKKLWKFNIGNIKCYRTSHPRYVAHNQYREQALDELISLSEVHGE